MRPDGNNSFSLIPAATDAGKSGALFLFLFDLLYLDGEAISARHCRIAKSGSGICWRMSGHRYSTVTIRAGATRPFTRAACDMPLEAIVWKRADAPYVPGNRCLWVKTKCMHREEFVVVGWTDPEASGPVCWVKDDSLVRHSSSLCPAADQHEDKESSYQQRQRCWL